MLLEFQQSQYTTREDQLTVEVCVTLSGPIAFNITANIIESSGGSAERKNDYQFSNATLTFIPGRDRILCQSINITADEVFERYEDFFLILFLDNIFPNVILGNSETTVVIEDSTQLIITLLTVNEQTVEGESASLCFSNNVILEQDVTVQINLDSPQGNSYACQ